MSDEPQHTYSAREIVLELFPATPERLVPGFDDYHLEPHDDGSIVILTKQGNVLLSLFPVATSGHPTTQLCCDFCQRGAPRHYLQVFRIEVPTSQGRRFRYVTLCNDHEGCSARRFDDKPIRQLLAKVFDES